MKDMRGVAGELYCASRGTNYRANNEGVIVGVADQDTSDLIKLGAEMIRVEAKPADPSAFEPMDHNAEQHQAGDILQK